jgi:D-tyrosyl-tRNA(Tyr) deacylase
MRAVVQRVRSARVLAGDRVVAEIGQGVLVLAGIRRSDGGGVAETMARKVVELLVFEDDQGKMNLSVADVGGSILCVSQFTLYGDVRRGRRPSFAEAATSEEAEPLYESFCEAIEAHSVSCRRGTFGAEMQVELVHDGPVTLILDSDILALPRRA